MTESNKSVVETAREMLAELDSEGNPLYTQFSRDLVYALVDEINLLNLQIQVKDETIKGAGEYFAQMTGKIHQLSFDLSHTKNAMGDQASVILRQERQLVKLRQDYGIQLEMMQQEKQTSEQYKQMAEEWHQNKDSLHKEITMISRQLSTTELHLSDARKEIENNRQDLKTQRDIMESDAVTIRKQRQEIIDLGGELVKKQTMIDQRDELIEGHKSTIISLEKDKEELTTECVRLESLCNQRDVEIIRLKHFCQDKQAVPGKDTPNADGTASHQNDIIEKLRSDLQITIAGAQHLEQRAEEYKEEIARLSKALDHAVNLRIQDKEEILRLKQGKFTEDEFQNLCHNLPTDDTQRFFKGCIDYQNQLFGCNAVWQENVACSEIVFKYRSDPLVSNIVRMILDEIDERIRQRREKI